MAGVPATLATVLALCCSLCAASSPLLAWAPTEGAFPNASSLRMGRTLNDAALEAQLATIIASESSVLLVSLEQLSLKDLSPIKGGLRFIQSEMTAAPSSIVVPATSTPMSSLWTMLEATRAGTLLAKDLSTPIPDTPNQLIIAERVDDVQAVYKHVASKVPDALAVVIVAQPVFNGDSSVGADTLVWRHGRSTQLEGGPVLRQGLSSSQRAPRLFFTGPIWMGLLVALLTVGFILLGSYLMMMTQTPDRFADPGDKNLEVPA